jgi:hypothetical protein
MLQNGSLLPPISIPPFIFCPKSPASNTKTFYGTISWKKECIYNYCLSYSKGKFELKVIEIINKSSRKLNDDEL